MDWSNETTFEFLEAYQAEAVLWDLTHEHHKDKRKVNDAWCRLSITLNRSVEELKKKKDSLMATYRGHLRKKKASIASGASMENVYQPTWFAFEYMEKFLTPVYEVTQNVNTDDLIIEDEFTLDDIDEAWNVLVPMKSQSSRGSQFESTPSARQQANSRPTIRQRQNFPELLEAGNQMLQFTNEKREDECDLYSRILVKKLKRLPEEERDSVMYEIDGLILNRRRKLSSGTIPSRMDSSPSSGASISSYKSNNVKPP